MILPAQRMQLLTTTFFAALGPKIEALQAAGKDVIRLDEGSPDLPPAPPIIAALAHSAAAATTHSYQPHRGPKTLRSAWAEMYRRVYGISLDADSEVVPLLGSKEGIFHFSAAFLNPGDVSLIPDPGYMTYTRGALFCGAEPYFMPLRLENHFLPDLQFIPAGVLHRAKLLWLNYPNNPTAAVASREFFAGAVAFAHQHGLLLCHDAAYTQVTFDNYYAASLLEIDGAKEVAVEFNSLSKSHNMAGWRVGALLGNAQALKTFFTLKTNIDSSHFFPILAAATEAMTSDQAWLAKRNEVYRLRRDIVVQAVNALGLPAMLPQASIYVWCPLPAGWTCLDFVNLILEETAVSLTPGTVFGENGEGYVRISLTAPAERLAEAMQRMAKLFPLRSKRGK
jgi:LL-diaminopimelate aminotransferase